MALGDFEKAKTALQEKLNTAQQEAEKTKDMTNVEKINQEMEALEAKKDTYDGVAENAEAGPNENQIHQVEGLGGSPKELNQRLEGNKEEVKKVEEGVVEPGSSNLEDWQIKLEEWNKGLTERIAHLNGNIEMGNAEATASTTKMREAVGRGDKDSEKLHKDSVNHWDSWTEAKRRDLREAQAQLEKNQKELQQGAPNR